MPHTTDDWQLATGNWQLATGKVHFGVKDENRLDSNLLISFISVLCWLSFVRCLCWLSPHGLLTYPANTLAIMYLHSVCVSECVCALSLLVY